MTRAEHSHVVSREQATSHAGKRSPSLPPASRRADRIAGALVLGMLAAISAAILRFRIFFTHDSISSYAHVWYISDRLWHGHGLPLHMPVLAHGEAFAYPYGFLPWTIAAIARPLFGDWTVTFTIVACFWLMLGAMSWAFPELRARPLLGIAAVANPAVVIALLAAQLPFMAAAALLFVAIGLWRRRRASPWIAAAAALAQLTHAAVVLPIAAGIVAVRLLWPGRRRKLLAIYAAACVATIPAILLVIASPVFSDASLGVKLFQFTTTVAERAPVIVVPILATLIHPTRRWLAVIAFVVVASNVAVGPLDTGLPWHTIVGGAPEFESIDPLIASPIFVRGAVYRVLEAKDGHVPAYSLLRAGAILDSELFPESIRRESFAADEYARFVHERRIDFVIVASTYTSHYRTNEESLLSTMTGAASCEQFGMAVSRVPYQSSFWNVFRIDRGCVT